MFDYHPLTRDEFDALTAKADAGDMTDEFALACSVDNGDHLHTRAIGAKGDGLAGRVHVLVHDDGGDYASVYITAAEARGLAANLLNSADHLDGVAPLVFFPREVDPAEDPDRP